MGRPASLEKALVVASVNGRTRLVEQVEIFKLDRGTLKEHARAFRKLGSA